MHYLLEVKEWEEVGELGLVIKGKSNRPHFDPTTTAIGLTHDILEHTPKQISNPIEDELIALGAFYYIRVLGCYDTGYRVITVEDLANNIYSLLEDIHWEFDGLEDPKQYWTKDKYLNSDIKEAALKAIKLYKEYNEEYPLDINIRYLIGWICKGYSLTKARYRKYDSYDLAYKFKSISKQLERLVKSVEYEGQQFKLKINLQNSEVNWEELNDEETYY